MHLCAQCVVVVVQKERGMRRICALVVNLFCFTLSAFWCNFLLGINFLFIFRGFINFTRFLELKRDAKKVSKW